jgi:hypothetical protein
LRSSIRKNVAPERSERWFPALRLVGNGFNLPFHLGTQEFGAYLPKSRKATRDATIRETKLMALDAALARGSWAACGPDGSLLNSCASSCGSMRPGDARLAGM